MADKKSCDHLVGYPESFFETAKNFSFCPLCGQPLQKTALDKVILKAARLDPAVELFPSQSLWDAAEVLEKAKFRRDKDCLSIDFSPEDENFEIGASGLWWPGVAKSPNETKETTLAKALLWTLTELTVEDIEKLFETKS